MALKIGCKFFITVFCHVQCTPMYNVHPRFCPKHSGEKKSFILFIYLFIFRERGREGDRETNTDVWEKHWSVASCMPPTGDLACNPGMCPDWELNWWPFGPQASTQSTKPHQPGPCFNFNSNFCLLIFRNKTNDHIPGYYFVYRYRFCFLELHF